MDDERRLRQEVLKNLVDGNDSILVAMGNYINPDNDELMDIEFAVNASEEELFTMFTELFKNKTVRDEARKAVLYSDYGNEDIDSLNLN
jgi:hypothetical protein